MQPNRHHPPYTNPKITTKTLPPRERSLLPGIALPTVVTRREVNALRALTAQMRKLGRAGNGGMPDVLTPVAIDAERLLRIAPDSDYTAHTLRLALAELHTLAGYCAHDMHLIGTARWHYSRATTVAGEAKAAATTRAGEAEAVAEAVAATWHAAIMERDNDPDMALKLLQLAQTRGTEAITPALDAALCVASARVYSIMGRTDDANRYLMRSCDLKPPERVFDRAALDNVRAQCYLAMGEVDAAHHYVELSLNTFDPDDRRESIKARITLATVHAVAGEPSAEQFAAAALNGAEALHSVRVRSQLEPLETALAKRPNSTYADLAHRAHAIRLAA
jgi:tetratricopeptide (TPR) repeat protein